MAEMTIEQMRAKVVAHDQAEAEAKRAEAMAKIQPVVDAFDEMKPHADVLTDLLTPDLLVANEPLYERLKGFKQMVENLRAGVEGAKAIAVPGPIPLTHGAAPEPAT